MRLLTCNSSGESLETLQAESTDVLTAVSVSAIVFFLLLLSLTAAVVSTLALGRKKLKKPQDTETKGDSTCNAKKVPVVPNHAYASVKVSRHVKVPKGDSTCNVKKVPVVPNHAYASVNVSRHVKVPKGDSTCNAKKLESVPVVPNHAYASVNVSRHVKVPVYPNAAYAVCKPVKSKSVKVDMLPNKANVPTNTTVSGCTNIPVYPNEVYTLSNRVEAPVYELVT